MRQGIKDIRDNGKIRLRIKDCPGNCSAGFFLRADLAYSVCRRSSRPSAHHAEQVINRRDFPKVYRFYEIDKDENSLIVQEILPIEQTHNRYGQE